MKHRHLEYPASTRAEQLPSAAIADILDRGDLDAWRPLAVAIRAHPRGPLSERVLGLLDAYPMYGTSALWRSFIERCRIEADARDADSEETDLATLRKRLGLTQAEVAARLGISQSDLSKLEHRKDVRLSTLAAYAKALGGSAATVLTVGGARVVLKLAGAPGRATARPRRSRPMTRD